MMSGIRGKNTRPELLVRKALFARGFRYRLHYKVLPGKPDLVFPKYRAVIFINGCFWHGHQCNLFKWPSTRESFWQQKITGNIARDALNRDDCSRQGWKVLVVWECALKGSKRSTMASLTDRIEYWLVFGVQDSEIVGGDS